MKAFELDHKQKWLFCMTHPDDEISICAFIKRLTESGHEVFLSWTHSTAPRQQEGTKAATNYLGVRKDQIFTLEATDGEIAFEMPDLLPKFQTLLEDIRPDRICCGAFEQGHIDHDSTNLMVNTLYTGPVLEIPFYHTYTTRFQTMNDFATKDKGERLNLTSEETKFKIEFAKQFPSQTIWRNLVAYEAWQALQRKPVELSKRELMRFQSHKNFLQPNLPEPLAHRVKNHKTWQRWTEAATQVLRYANSECSSV